MDTPKIIQDIYKSTKIYSHFVSCSSSDKHKLVDELIYEASGILDRIIETFPTYTLHNGQHQLNILNLYENLLGDRLNQLTDLESAILILSAFYHDIGMTFKDSERENLIEEEYFDEFLTENVRAKLTIAEDKEITSVTAEWYCRWSHAKRVWKYLNNINEKLLWDGFNIRKELAEVCLSHNEQAEYIKENYIPSIFFKNSDLKFCAILLRLADILDFDNTRVPEYLYQFLGLDKPKSSNEEVSQKEWQKHFASKGFSFDNWNQENNYTIHFQAAPNNPTVEHDILVFLNNIEKELKECSSILRFCSNKWKNFKLPEKIDRQNIISQGYTFGDFKFSLDQEQVLALLMGESLYDSQYVFIRELLQNAIDTSRHRKFYEINKGNNAFIPEPVNVSTWYDLEGYRWVKVDDCGMGMTFSQISNYFLKVGNSYYNSDEFKVEKLSYNKENHDFVPVSRFGIGILSCFIVGDIVEVNTRSIFSDNKNTFPIRLSLKGLHNYYVLQTNKDIPSEMPNYKVHQNTYRKEIGTSIAIRIRPNNDLPDFNLSKILDSTLFNPEVPVNLINRGQKGRYLKELDITTTDTIIHNLNGKELKEIKDFVSESNIKNVNPILYIIPINLNGVFSHPDLKGFLYVFYLKTNYTKIDIKNSLPIREIFHLSYSTFNKTPELKLNFNNGQLTELEEEKSIDLSYLLKPIEIFNGKSNLDRSFDSIVLSHNGIIIPNKKDSVIEFKLENTNKSHIIGYIELSDKLRPNLSVARSNIRSISWSLWSTLNYTIRRNFPEKFKDLKRVNFLRLNKVNIVKSDLNEDILLIDKKYWPSEKIFQKNNLSIIELLNLNVKLYTVFKRTNDPESLLKKKLVELYSTYKITLYKELNFSGKYQILKVGSAKKFNSDTYLSKPKYPPLTFCEYENFSGLMPEELNNQIFNINHPFSKWLIKSFLFLEINYSNHLYILLNNTDLKVVNTTISKLREHVPDEYKPSDNLFLTKDDFIIDFKGIPLNEK